MASSGDPALQQMPLPCPALSYPALPWPALQPSVCQAEGSSILWAHLHQQPGTALRFVAFVEIMASAFRFDFFQAGAAPAACAGALAGRGQLMPSSC